MLYDSEEDESENDMVMSSDSERRTEILVAEIQPNNLQGMGVLVRAGFRFRRLRNTGHQVWSTSST